MEQMKRLQKIWLLYSTHTLRIVRHVPEIIMIKLETAKSQGIIKSQILSSTYHLPKKVHSLTYSKRPLMLSLAYHLVP